MLPTDDFSHVLFHSRFFFEVPTSGHYSVFPRLMAFTKIPLEFHLGGEFIFEGKKSWQSDRNQCYALSGSSAFLLRVFTHLVTSSSKLQYLERPWWPTGSKLVARRQLAPNWETDLECF